MAYVVPSAPSGQSWRYILTMGRNCTAMTKSAALLSPRANHRSLMCIFCSGRQAGRWVRTSS